MIQLQHEDGRIAQVEDFQKAEFEAEGFTEVKPVKPAEPVKPPEKGKK
jgi:hypothetical protein